ncbi:tigger transposable element-derived protein 2-like [Fopius arisanus]|uniref:Tigd2_0 protein n=1 Tax=Fopius arisanus TaxID=64838 RepID=A0A0C9RG77_9HYME|nr:PREDICTED: tigger transposable element-derived protein 2-like [Fopius arisanus]
MSQTKKMDSSAKLKRPLKLWDLDIKLKAVEKINRGEDLRSVAKDLGVHRKTVRRWVANETEIRKWTADHEGGFRIGTKRMRLPEYPMIDWATWIWFKQQRAAGVPITGTTVQAQARYLWQSSQGDSDLRFKASPGWLARWKLRHGVKKGLLFGEQLAADEADDGAYKEKLAQMIKDEKLTPEQVFNCSEMRLNYRHVPRITLNSSTVTTSQESTVKNENLTVMACCNASGTLKLPLMVVGNNAKLRAYKDVKSLPVFYRNHQSAWMNTFLFEEWFQEEFVPKVEKFLDSQNLRRKAILFMDNCSAYPNGLRVNEFRVEFLPPNLTTLIQPIDQGCLHDIKTLYKVKLMTFMVEKLKKGDTVLEALKSLTTREVLFWLDEAWSTITPSTIINRWKKLWPNIVEILSSACLTPSEPSLLINEHRKLSKEFHRLLQNHENHVGIELDEVQQWMNCNPLLQNDECLTDEEILQIIDEETTGRPKETSEFRKENDHDVTVESSTTVTELYKALECFDKVIKFCEKDAHYSLGDLQDLYRIKQIMKTQVLRSNADDDDVICEDD